MEELNVAFQSIPWALLAPIIVIQLILVIVAIIDWIRIEETNGPKWLWLIIILFLNIIGPILYFIVGRRQT
ncbi:PLDc N-terminal domain-containing protein [Anaerobacillus sp. MEB173]|uniref:PLDc N-terminal domain-containing protein n=1 Tax=Anaerobacillus sp. MEB173 TaxID=3383345 RepID=UPI003F903405